MDKIALLEMFPCCQGIDKSYGNLGDTFVLEATVNRERTAMMVRALFSAMPAPAEVSAMEWAIAAEFGLREVKIEATWPQEEPKAAREKKASGAPAGGRRSVGKRGLKFMYTFRDFVGIVAELRSDHGCPWDRAQTFETMKEYLASETQEVFEAVDRHDMENLCEELGDVLLQVVLNSQIAAEQGAFTIDDVIDGISRKMIRRHPHVFGDVKVSTPEESLALWNEIKKREKAEKP